MTIGLHLDPTIAGNVSYVYNIKSFRRLTLYKLAFANLQNSNDFFIAIGSRGGLIAFLQKPKQSGNALLIITTAAGKPFAETMVRYHCTFVI